MIAQEHFLKIMGLWDIYTYSKATMFLLTAFLLQIVLYYLLHISSRWNSESIYSNTEKKTHWDVHWICINYIG